MKLRINVTTRDIERGRWGPSSCPVTRAARRHKALAECRTGVLGIVGTDRNYMLPESARAFIRAFDAGNAVEPFSFVMEV